MRTFLKPEETNRCEAFRLWDMSFQPRVTLTKTYDVSPLLDQKEPFEVLLSWCAAKAASTIPEFYLVPGAGGFYAFEDLGIVTQFRNENGDYQTISLPFDESFETYLRTFHAIADRRKAGQKPEPLDDLMRFDCLPSTFRHLDLVSLPDPEQGNPVLYWGEVREDGTLPVSFQFNHIQMDGYEAAEFLENLQQEIRKEKC